MTEGKRIPRLRVTAQGRLVDDAIIQRVKEFEKPNYKFQTDVDLHEMLWERHICLCQPIVKMWLFACAQLHGLSY